MTTVNRGDPAYDDILRSVFGEVDADFAALVETEIRRLSGDGLRLVESPHRGGARTHDLFLDTRTPVEPWSPLDYVRSTLTDVIDGSVRTGSPMCLSNMSTVLPTAMPSLAALVTTLNQNLVKTEAARMLSRCERQVLGMLHRLVYRRSDSFYRETVQSADATLGLVTTGGSLANLAALWVSRNRALPDVRRDGLAAALGKRAAPGACVVGPASMHYSFAKAADILGIGAAGLRRVALDRHGRMDERALRRVLREARSDGWVVLAVVAVAGTTDAGAVDPLAGAADAAEEAGAPLHVDAAWGAPVVFSRRHRHLLDGLDRADTVTVDGHKEFHAPTGVAAVLFRVPSRADVIEHTADYAVREGSLDLGRRSLEGSRPGSVLLLHAALHLLGERGYEQVIDRSLRQAEGMAEQIRRRPELELLLEPELNIVLYRYLPPDCRGSSAAPGPVGEADGVIDAVNTALYERQRAAGSAQVSRTRWDIGDEAQPRQIVALRAVLANPATTLHDIREVLAGQVRLGDEIVGRWSGGRSLASLGCGRELPD